MGAAAAKASYNFRQTLVPKLKELSLLRDAASKAEVTALTAQKSAEAAKKGSIYTDPNALIGGFTRGAKVKDEFDNDIDSDSSDAKRKVRINATTVPEMNVDLINFMNTQGPVKQQYNDTLCVSADEKSPPFDKLQALSKSMITNRPLPKLKTSPKTPAQPAVFPVESGIVTPSVLSDVLKVFTAPPPPPPPPPSIAGDGESESESNNLSATASDKINMISNKYNIPPNEVHALVTGLGIPVVHVELQTGGVFGIWHDVDLYEEESENRKG